VQSSASAPRREHRGSEELQRWLIARSRAHDEQVYGLAPLATPAQHPSSPRVHGPASTPSRAPQRRKPLPTALLRDRRARCGSESELLTTSGRVRLRVHGGTVHAFPKGVYRAPLRRRKSCPDKDYAPAVSREGVHGSPCTPGRTRALHGKNRTSKNAPNLLPHQHL